GRAHDRQPDRWKLRTRSSGGRLRRSLAPALCLSGSAAAYRNGQTRGSRCFRTTRRIHRAGVTMPNVRLQKGLEVLRQVDPRAAETLLTRFETISPELARLAIEFGYADV